MPAGINEMQGGVVGELAVAVSDDRNSESVEDIF